MNFERCKRGFRSDRRGVSEVVGNILILMITVVLFSSIVMYVNQIPVPETTTKADFAASVTFETAGTTTASLTVTHAGGVVLDSTQTAVFIQAGAYTYYDKLSEDANFSYSRWTTGTDWTKSFTVESEYTEIVVTVIDLDKDSAVWSSQVSGGSGGTPPIILQRYVDSDDSSPTADPILQNDQDFSFYVKVTDLDNDLDTSTSGVWIDSSQLPGGNVVDTYEESTEEGWFKFDFGAIASDVSLIDGKLIKIHAKDDAGHETVSSFVVSVTVLPTNILNLPWTPTYGGLLYDFLTDISAGQGWGTYKQNLTSGTVDVDNPSRNFTKDEVIFVIAGSVHVTNLMGANELTLRDMRTNTVYVPEFNGSSTESEPFYVLTIGGAAVYYECQFKTDNLPPGAYELRFNLQESGADAPNFEDGGPVYIEQEGSPIDFMPALWVYSDADRETDWGSRSNPFDVTGASESRVYVSVKVQDAADTPSPIVDDVRLTDMRGDTQLHGTPPSGGMMTAWEANTDDPDNHTYEFMIDLRLNNGDQWISGVNSYTLQISRFADENEGVYNLLCKLHIRASASKSDFFIGAAGFMTGTSNFVNPAYLYYIENNNFFTKRTMYDYSNAPSAADNYATSAFALGDIDGDGDKDVLIGQYRSHHLYFIENSLNSFGAWQEASQITRPTTDDTDADINWIATGDTNGDGDIDFAYSTHNEGSSEGRTVVIYNNTYGATGYLWDPPGPQPRYNDTNDGVRKIALEDMTGDGRDDLIVLAEGRVWIYDLQEWDPSSTIAVLPGWGDAPTSADTNIQDFDIADVDGDGFMDVVTTDSDIGETRGVNVWYYVEEQYPDEVKLTGEPVTTAGQVTNPISYTYEDADGNALELRENSTEEDVPQGKLIVNMVTNQLSDEPYQQLEVRAKVSATGGTPAEGFYIWYSTDGSMFTPLIYVPAVDPTPESEYDYYTRTLPSSVAGQTLTIRITDTLNTVASGSVVETLHLDYLAVITGTFGHYERHKVDATSGWECVAVGNINGVPGFGDDLGLEVVVAKDGSWKTFNRTGDSPEEWTAYEDWADDDPSLYVRGDTMIDLHSSMTSDENPIKQIMTYSSPRLFKVTDVNGDGFDDIIVTNSTIATAITSQVAMFLNTHGCAACTWIYYVVKDIAADFNTPDVRGGMTWLGVADLST